MAIVGTPFTTATALLARGEAMYKENDDCIGFAAAVYGLPREGFLTSLLNKQGFYLIDIVRKQLPISLLLPGDIFLFMPHPNIVHQTHVALYLEGEFLLSKFGMEPGLVSDTFLAHTEYYEPTYTLILRREEK